MARLNDYAAPAESIEALKRRFVRQNRELARVNSMQSLRIRSLESEVSHLLGENVSLREQVINLTSEIERLEAAKLLHDGVYEIKARLDTKLAELNSLASDLGMLPRRVGKINSKLEGNTERPKTALEPRRAADFNPAMDGGKLPSIVEDKYFPRRTLETEEIQQLVQADLSPSQFSDESMLPQETGLYTEPHAEEPMSAESPSPPTQETFNEGLGDDAQDSEQFLPPTLETRKKKKRTEPTPLLEETVSENRPTSNDNSTHAAKPGSKRKFSPDEDGFPSDTAPEDDEFEFSRPNQSPRRKSDFLQSIRQDLSPSKTPRTMKRVPPGGITKRKVLEPKSANANLASPKKSRSLQPENKIAQLMGDGENAISPVKPKQLENPKAKPARDPRPVTKQKEKRSTIEPPEVLSSDYEQPKQTQKRDSPVAKSVGMETLSDLASASRTSRRRGAVVSYAEPNLRDKMRRPTKDMIDAVAKDGRRSSSFQSSRESMGDGASDTPSAGRSVVGPYPPAKNNMPADFALANQATDIFSGDAALAKVSQRRQTRRHSSNPQKTSYDPSPVVEDVSRNSESPDSSNVSLGQVDLAFQADDDSWKAVAQDVGPRRETRVAARRRSMMV